MSHASRADKLLIKPAAGARPAPPRTRRQFIPKARRRRPVTRRVTRGTATTRLAIAPDRARWRVLPSPQRLWSREVGARLSAGVEPREPDEACAFAAANLGVEGVRAAAGLGLHRSPRTTRIVLFRGDLRDVFLIAPPHVHRLGAEHL